jgi:gas vesicle protein
MANYASSSLQGMGTGAAAGSAFGPWGALIGGGVGLAAGLFSAWEQEQDERKKQQILERAAQQLNTDTATLKAMAEEYYRDNQSTGRKDDVQTYRDLIDNYDPNEFVYDAPEFNDNFDVNDYYAANKDAIINKTADAIQARAAGQGIGRGTGAANAIATGVAEKNEELYKDALAARNSDRNFAYSLWQANIKNAQDKLRSLQEGTNTQLSLYGNLAEDYQNWQNAKFQTQLDLDKQKMNNDLSLTLASI